jgi:hypothetical protein
MKVSVHVGSTAVVAAAAVTVAHACVRLLVL